MQDTTTTDRPYVKGFQAQGCSHQHITFEAARKCGRGKRAVMATLGSGATYYADQLLGMPGQWSDGRAVRVAGERVFEIQAHV